MVKINLVVHLLGRVGGLAIDPQGIGCVDRNLDVVDLWPGRRREVCAIARLVGVLIRNEANKVMYLFLAIIRYG